MNIEKYSAYFHDGNIDNLVILNRTNIIITIESAQIDEDENEDKLSLGRFSRVRGRLHLFNIVKITINNRLSSIEDLVFTNGSVFDLKFKNKQHVTLNVFWNYQEKNFQSIEFEVKNYFFELRPDLIFKDDVDFDEEGRYIGST